MTDKRKGLGVAQGHVSYLLRLWRERGSASTWWRASLQDPLSGERIGFAHLDELVAFLRAQTGLAAEDLEEGERTPMTEAMSEEGGGSE